MEGAPRSEEACSEKRLGAEFWCCACDWDSGADAVSFGVGESVDGFGTRNEPELDKGFRVVAGVGFEEK